MRCPKCHYISFGSVTRCRNCGYEFSLSPDPQPADLPMQSPDAPVGPMRDLNLDPPAGRAAARAAAASGDADRPAVPGPRLDLPLFTDRDPLDDTPLISASSAPRPPLAVRRAPPPPSPPKPRFERSAAAPMLEMGDEGDPVESAEEDAEDLRRREEELRALRASLQARADRSSSPDAGFVVAPTWLRLVAGAVDVFIIAAIDAAVVLSTLRVLGLDRDQVLLLPVAPIALFLVLLNGGYLATFTAAGGQTIGKMLAGIRVIAQRPSDDGGFDRYTPRVSLGAAVLRATAYLASLLPAGLGFAAILLDKDRRALHDRLAETRVVRA
jgi:uncharacterized RDD family membrane protein YckC